MGGVPESAWGQQRVATARRLVAVDAGNPLANDVLGRDALRTFLFFRDRINIEPFVVDASGPGRESGTDARRFLEQALATDPDYRSAYEPLAAILAATSDWAQLLHVATHAAAQFPDWGEAVLWGALAQYRTGDASSADATGARGLALLPATERARYDDIADLLTPDQAEAYRADPEAVARAFWSREDVRLLTPANERRAEHIARRTEADLLFGWSGANGVETSRGRIWARYGAPRSRTQFSGSIYAGDRPCRIGCADVPDLYDVWRYDGFQFIFEDPGRSGEYRTYNPSALAFEDIASANAATNDDYVILDAQLRREQPERSQYAPARRERVPFLATPFRGADGRAEVVVAFGVPLAARLAPGTSARLSVETGVFVLRDGAALPVAERRRDHDALPASETIPLGDAAVWVGAETLRLAPGAYTLAAEFSAPGDVAGFERGPLAVPAFTGQGLELSGLLLAASAEEGAAGPVQRRGVGIVPAPLDAVSGRVSVYAEAYGLALNGGRTNYEVELALVPEDGRGTLGRLFGRARRGGVSTASSAQGASSDEAIVLSLDVSGQPAGAYTLALRVTDRVSGTAAETIRRVTVE